MKANRVQAFFETVDGKSCQQTITIALEFPPLPAKTPFMATSDFEVEREKSPAGAAQFANTHWSVVLSAANKQNPVHAAESLEKLCRVYWHPLYFFARRQGESPHDAQDLTQEFFARLLRNDWLDSVDRGKGRFRSFLLAAFKHFLSNERDRARAQKRGGGQIPAPLEAHNAETQYGFEPVENLTAEKIFERRWALTLLERTTARLRGEYERDGKTALFEQLKITLTEPRGAIAYADLGKALKMSEGAVKVAVHRLRQRYRAVLRAEVAETLADPADVEDEVRQIFRALAG
jgi:DNA-directed RNA polymerase specialized sigma24 family protein